MEAGGGVMRFGASAINRSKRVDFPEELGPDIIKPKGSFKFKSFSEKLDKSIFK
jgi:hypothetical protein